jgi:hypothetical protein
MEALSFNIELKIGTLHAKIPSTGELLIVLKDGKPIKVTKSRGQHSDSVTR